ncbi:trigger factor [Candidatus Falkowbacteria bacterium]|jgi:trigger factor|nr:trigger factor [Candidatus Falkowbacteria bacterium]MBT4433255.1 trigger factor [Candidatus Falkowbacteria bacterium]
MTITTKKLPKNQAELTIEVEYDKIIPFLEKAAPRLSEKQKIDGFRPGKAPYDVIKQKFGEAAILNEALDDIIRKHYIDAVAKEKLEPIDMPKVDVVKIAPGNPLVFKATISLLPHIKLCDIKKIKVNKKEVKVDEKKVDTAIKHIAESRGKEKLVDKKAGKSDILEVDMDILQNNVSIEGGLAKGHKIIMGEPHYIPGFEEKLKDTKAGDKKEFEVTFPKDHYNKNLAGKPVVCKVEVKGVYEREIPKIDDEFAKSLGKFKNLKELKDQVKDNIEKEDKVKEEQRQELEMLENLVKESEFDEIPEVLLKEETRKMIEELKANLAQQGVKLEDYLIHLKKSTEELQKDFLPQSEKRVKTGLLIREYVNKNKIETTEEDVEKEIEKMLAHYPKEEETQKQIKSEEHKNYLKTILVNRKAIKRLKKEIIK